MYPCVVDVLEGNKLGYLQVGAFRHSRNGFECFFILSLEKRRQFRVLSLFESSLKETKFMEEPFCSSASEASCILLTPLVASERPVAVV